MLHIRKQPREPQLKDVKAFQFLVSPLSNHIECKGTMFWINLSIQILDHSLEFPSVARLPAPFSGYSSHISFLCWCRCKRCGLTGDPGVSIICINTYKAYTLSFFSKKKKNFFTNLYVFTHVIFLFSFFLGGEKKKEKCMENRWP